MITVNQIWIGGQPPTHVVKCLKSLARYTNDNFEQIIHVDNNTCGLFDWVSGYQNVKLVNIDDEGFLDSSDKDVLTRLSLKSDLATVADYLRVVFMTTPENCGTVYMDADTLFTRDPTPIFHSAEGAIRVITKSKDFAENGSYIMPSDHSDFQTELKTRTRKLIDETLAKPRRKVKIRDLMFVFNDTVMDFSKRGKLQIDWVDGNTLQPIGYSAFCDRARIGFGEHDYNHFYKDVVYGCHLYRPQSMKRNEADYLDEFVEGLTVRGFLSPS